MEVLNELRSKSKLEQVGSYVNEVPDHHLKQSHEVNMLPNVRQLPATNNVLSRSLIVLL